MERKNRGCLEKNMDSKKDIILQELVCFATGPCGSIDLYLLHKISHNEGSRIIEETRDNGVWLSTLLETELSVCSITGQTL